MSSRRAWEVSAIFKRLMSHGHGPQGSLDSSERRLSVDSVLLDSQLGSVGGFTYVVGEPGGKLAALARNFWEVRGDFNFARDRMLPCGQAAIVFSLGAPQTLISAGERRELSGAWVCGAQLQPSVSVSPSGTWICGARLTNRGGFLALGVSPRSLAGKFVDLVDIWGARARDLCDRLRCVGSPAERFALIGGEILRASEDRPQWNEPVDHAVCLLRAAQGQRSVQSLADEIGWSRQWLHRSFDNFLGMSPKAMARLERFSHAVDLIGFTPEVDLAGVAHGAGYYDQAHFTREFSEFSGLTPGAFLRSRIPDAAIGFN